MIKAKRSEAGRIRNESGRKKRLVVKFRNKTFLKGENGMKKLFAVILCAAMLMGGTACASNFYLIEDSDTRLLTREELWGWSYEALGYVFNEIFARHGYHFEPGGRYQAYFMAQEWYEESDQYMTNEEIYQHEMTSVEWANERLCKDVLAEMRALGTTNSSGKPLPEVFYEPEIQGAFSSFEKISLPGNGKLRVYSGPGTSYWRGSNGKAMASTNGKVYACGWEAGWLMVMYWTNGGSVRVGYTPSGDLNAFVDLPMLSFAYEPAVITSRCVLTDDPVMTNVQIKTLQEGAQVCYLGEFVNHTRWAYVETEVSGQTVRGFVPAKFISFEGKYK